jgi:signal transduction histidine kinase
MPIKQDLIIRRALLYTILTGLAALAYALIVAGASLVLLGIFNINHPLFIGGLIVLLALLVNPIRERLQGKIDLAFSKRLSTTHKILQAFTHRLDGAESLSKVATILLKYLLENIQSSSVYVFILDPVSNHFIAVPDANGQATTDLRFPEASALAQALAEKRRPITITKGQELPNLTRVENARLMVLDSQVIVPLAGRDHLAGWVSVGPRLSGEDYSPNDIAFIESLTEQAALVADRILTAKNLERRMQEMNVLTRVSQGVNVTLAFDDLLELVYAQTIQVIPSRDFFITLQDTHSNHLYHVFYLENDERLAEKEGLPLPAGQGLENIVVQSQRSLLSDDYEKECKRHAVRPAMEGISAWIGVPLNSGTETIGLISLGNRNSTVNYTSQQLDILQAIADQTAGAIVKGRLLEDAERRTKQLTSLNEVTRSLTSTLDLDHLLEQILGNAIEIMGCDSGNLLLVDPQRDELVFAAARGPVATELIGERLPLDTGLVGQAVQSGQPIIANASKQSTNWPELSNQESAHKLQDLLVVPLQFQDQVIGVIEVVNRKDKLPFNIEDQELLTAYNSQAAIALENARLYTLTDQALAARVQELSVMQRIDRELNASLDVQKAMEITLEWAMRQSQAQAGIIGWLETNGFSAVASAGYPAEILSNGNLSTDIGLIKKAIESGLPQADRTNNEPGHQGLLLSSQTQIVVPIQREDRAIGALFLESEADQLPSEETLAFLSRLSDHAAIAIANAQLYSEVQAANLAKSEFVSFVSHELKTPMTSIKGFTDLLSAGVVGPINDAQSNFLSTIRSNVDRMATLVSDLADVSRIETGRLHLDFSAVDLQEVVEEVVRSVRRQLEEKEQSLTLNLPESLPPGWGDRTRLIQILTNLLVNAHKYSPPNSAISLHAEAMENKWDAAGARRVLHLSIKDNGYGINEEDQRKIFQKFFRSEDQKIRDTAGTGLGLNITKTLVEMQGGKIWFDTEYRKGTTFHFTVPVVEG